jgi:type IV secretion system protein VirD4
MATFDDYAHQLGRELHAEYIAPLYTLPKRERDLWDKFVFYWQSALWILVMGALALPVAWLNIEAVKYFYKQHNFQARGIPLAAIEGKIIYWIYRTIGAGLGFLLAVIIGKFFNIVWFGIIGGSPTVYALGWYVLVPISFLVSIRLFRGFLAWDKMTAISIREAARHGSARFAFPDELADLDGSHKGTQLTPERIQERNHKAEGLYIGNFHYFPKRGHLLTVGGTRGGKGVNLIVPNLIPTGGFSGSFVVIDPKGENAAVTAFAQVVLGRKVIILNPWELQADKMPSNTAATYNPLDLLKRDRLNLSDDAKLIAETLVPSSPGKADHFNDRARGVIASLVLHLVTAAPEADRHLGTLWAWLRLGQKEWVELLVAMEKNTDPNAGDIIRGAALSLAALAVDSPREYGSILSTAQRWTEFLDSPALRDSLLGGSGFTSADLADGNTTVYVIIPADRLKTHYQWLRLVVSALLRSVVRNPQKDVCFILDEFYALGYLSEVETALGTYAGYGVHIWAIVQTLTQLKDAYGPNWENFINSCSVRHFFNMSDNMTLDYVSHLFGNRSEISFDRDGNVSGSTSRPLISADELRRGSEENIYTLIEQRHPVAWPKSPYYSWPWLHVGPFYQPNPYVNDGKVYLAAADLPLID